MSLTLDDRRQLARVRLMRDETEPESDLLVGLFWGMVLSAPVWVALWIVL